MTAARQSPASATAPALPAGRWRAYPAYTDSGVEWLGQIPAHWEQMRLRFLATLNPAKSQVAGYPADTEVSFLPMENISEDGRLSLTETRQLAQVGQGYTFFCDGDVLVAKITPCFENGKGALCHNLANGIGFGTTELHVIRASRRLDARFASYVTRTSSFRDIGTAMMQGAAGQQRVPEDFVKDWRLALPPLAEQRAIADFLDRETARLDALVAAKERLIALLHEKRAALISSAVTRGLDPSVPLRDSGVTWLGRIPAHWEVKELRRLARPGTAITYGIVQAGPDIIGGIPYIRTSDMAGDHLPESGYLRTCADIDQAYARSRVEPGDIVVAIRASVGKALPVPDYLAGANLTQGTAKVCPGPSVRSQYLLRVLQSPKTQQRMAALAKGATFREITLDMLRRLAAPLPPSNEQDTIIRYIERQTAEIDTLIAKVREHIERVREYRAALIAAAVTGKIDVRGET